MKKAVVLLSGGLDSTTVLAIAKSQKFDLYALSFNYGQRHEIELKFAKEVAKDFEAKEHKIAEIDLRIFGGSALTADISVPKDADIAVNKKIPVTYVPARNTIFLSYSLAYAEVIGAFDIFIGVNAIDYSGYPDCRPEFIQTFEKLANLATAVGTEGERKFKIHTPLIEMSKAEIIQTGIALGIDYSKTHSCYDPIVDNDGRVITCGRCDSCRLRAEGFRSAGLKEI